MQRAIPFSVLELALLKKEDTAADAYRRSLELARHAENQGYKRFWLAEHHNMPWVGSSAPTILMGYIAQGTRRIRVGSGGIMLPNHSPLVVAEQIGTLESLYPGRIDLGLGRAPGTDQRTAASLRRGRLETVQEFPQDLEELQGYFLEENLDSPVRAFPAEGLPVPFYLLGSSMDSARLAAAKGMPYVFASHFAPTYFQQAASYYRRHFRAYSPGSRPYLIACINVVAAESQNEAEFLNSSFYQMALGIIRGRSVPLAAPVASMDALWTAQEAAAIRHMTTYSFVGDFDRVKNGLAAFVREHRPDELMISSSIYDQEKRLTSYALAAQAIQSLSGSPQPMV
jgi:luciferase family oxidoreductase group 1